MSVEICLARSLAIAPPLLESLGNEISQKHTAFERSSLENARVIGGLLTYAREEVKKQSQSWQKWLKTSCPAIKERTARLYMQVYRDYEEIAAAVADPENLSLKEFQKRLNARNPKQRSSSEPGYVADLQSTSQQFEKSLDLFLDSDLNSYSDEALSNTLETLKSLEGRINLIRKKLANYQRSSAN
jgi:serine/threonine protein kinase